MAIHRRLRKLARAALRPFRRGRFGLERFRKDRRLAVRVLTDRDVDERLAHIEVQVKTGGVIDLEWLSFHAHYFPELDDDEAADVLSDWCHRHGIEPVLREGISEPERQRVFRLFLKAK
jgi:hypothetical protein